LVLVRIFLPFLLISQRLAQSIFELQVIWCWSAESEMVCKPATNFCPGQTTSSSPTCEIRLAASWGNE